MHKLKYDILMIYRGLREISRIRSNLLALVYIHSVLEALMPFINIYMSALIINSIAITSLKKLLCYAGITIGLNFIITTVSSMLAKVINIMKTEFSHQYDMRISKKLIELDYAQMEDPETHRKRERIKQISDMNGGGIWMLFHSADLVKHFFTVVFSLSLIIPLFTSTMERSKGSSWQFICSPIPSVLLCSAILANALISMRINTISTGKMYQIMQDIVSFNRVYGFYFMEYLTNYHAGKDIRLYHEKSLLESEAMSLIGDCNKVTTRLTKNQIHYSGITTASTVIISGLVYFFVGLRALAGMFGVGGVVKYVSSINEFIGGFSGFMDQLAQLRANNEALKVYFEFMGTPSQNTGGNLSLVSGNTDCEIEFKDVSFRYPGNSEYTLHDINITIKNKVRLAIVGMNGSGKTTFIKLLCRLYEPTVGKILLNGRDIREYQYLDYISLLSVVFQDFQLFAFPLGQNVAADITYNAGWVKKCLRKAGFDARLSTMEEGLDGCLYKDFDEKGIEISGGEAQKIAIARAMYRNSPIVILDEPTAALDPISEYEIYSSFNELVDDRTTIFISHRLSACRFCDDIAVFDKGTIVQYGSHDKLVKETYGKYYDLWSAQAQYYVNSDVKSKSCN